MTEKIQKGISYVAFFASCLAAFGLEFPSMIRWTFVAWLISFGLERVLNYNHLRWEKPNKKSFSLYAIIALYLWWCVSLLWTENIDYGVSELGFRITLFLFPLFALFKVENGVKFPIKWMLLSFVLGNIVCTVVGLVTSYVSVLDLNIDSQYYFRHINLFYAKYRHTTFMAIGEIFSLIVYVYLKSEIEKLKHGKFIFYALFAILYLLYAVAIVVGQCRIAMIILGLVTVWYIFYALWNLGWKKLPFVLSVVFLLIGFFALKNHPRMQDLNALNFETSKNDGANLAEFENLLSTDTFNITTTKYEDYLEQVTLQKGETYTMTIRGFSSDEAVLANQQLAVFIMNQDRKVSKGAFVPETESTERCVMFTAPETEVYSIFAYPYYKEGFYTWEEYYSQTQTDGFCKPVTVEYVKVEKEPAITGFNSSLWSKLQKFDPRYDQWRCAKHCISENNKILGVGIGDREDVWNEVHSQETFKKFFFPVGNAHNEWLDGMCESGIVGCILLLCVFIGILLYLPNRRVTAFLVAMFILFFVSIITERLFGVMWRVYSCTLFLLITYWVKEEAKNQK